MIHKNKNAGFSILELSMVVLIVALITAGISTGRYLLNKSRITSAEYLTKRSPVVDIDGLIIWFETTSVNSLLEAQANNGSTVSLWHNLAVSNKDATQNTASSQPIYSTKVIGYLPALRFDGVDDFLTFDGFSLIGSNYTIFVVEKRVNDVSTTYPQYFIGGTATVSNSNLYLGYKTNTSIAHNQYNNGYTATTAAYSENNPKIHTFTHNIANGNKYYQNGLSLTITPDPTLDSSSLINNAGFAVGRAFYVGGGPKYYQGYVGEIIIFNRALTDIERADVELYLSTKWKIKLS